MSFLLNEYFFTIAKMAFAQDVDIPMGTDPAPHFVQSVSLFL